MSPCFKFTAMPFASLDHVAPDPGPPTFSFGLKKIGHSSPPKNKVVDTSQLGLSLCLFNSSPV